MHPQPAVGGPDVRAHVGAGAHGAELDLAAATARRRRLGPHRRAGHRRAVAPARDLLPSSK